MYTCKKMKLNTFRQVHVPRPSDFFARLNGFRPIAPESLYSGDNNIPDGRTTDVLRRIDSMDMAHIRAEAAQNYEKDMSSTEKEDLPDD